MLNFRNLLQVSLFSFIVGCCVGNHTPATTQKPTIILATQQEARRRRVEDLVNSTVAILPASEGVPISLCSGVWISNAIVLTAAHCVDENPPIFLYKTYKEISDHDPRLLLLIAADKEIDLAILVADPESIPSHSVVTFDEEKEMSIGDPVDIIGHTSGYSWTYSKGYISSFRKNIKGPVSEISKALQISAPVWMGNSGGGAFDEDGNLVGICSWVSKNGPHLSFFIHKDIILGFLRREMVKK